MQGSRGFVFAKPFNPHDGRNMSCLCQFLPGIEGEGTITAQKWARMAGKEHQLASWLANAGHDIEFLRPSMKSGDRTPDIRLDGELWEIQRITTSSEPKVRRRMSEGFAQAGNVIVDLSCNDRADDVVACAIDMLDDLGANKVIVVANGIVTLYGK